MPSIKLEKQLRNHYIQYMRKDPTMSKTHRAVWRAELTTPTAGLLGIIECNDLPTLRRQIVKEWIPTLDDGDIIQIFERYEN